MNQLQQLVNQLETHIINHEKTNVTVSQSSVGWQLDHSLLVINAIVLQLKNSNPQQYKWSFNWIRTYIKIINKIPRGKGKAPQVVQPTESSSTKNLTEKIAMVKKSIAELELLPRTCYFKHPYFGDLDLKSAIWFLKLHTKHHLKIIEDILKN